ncbi:MAG: hypothetical protein MUC29_10770, partial [Pyrinomonadaceae bacterium]|nr:hypothetical protein [Pyrinomonadaceae bacterium]
MKQKQQNNISENQIEDALASNLLLLKDILQLDFELKLIARQLRLIDGEKRLDLLLFGGKDLFLVELKAVKFSMEFIHQVLTYQEALIDLQDNQQLIKGTIKSYLLVTKATAKEINIGKQNNVEVIVFEPSKVLEAYYENLSAIATFLKLKPNDYGVYNLGLVNRTINELGVGENKRKRIAEKINLSELSVKNHLIIGKELGLIRERNHLFFLTDSGEEYFIVGNKDALVNSLTVKQIEIIKSVVSKEP